MKKIIMSSIIASALGLTSAFADVAATVASKSYVDSGLQAVYNNVNGKIGDINTVIGNVSSQGVEASGLLGQIEALQDAVGDGNDSDSIVGRIEALESNGFSSQSAGAGIDVTSGTISINGLDTTTGSDNKIYVLQNNEATELNVQTTWSNPEWLQ
ncbi:MAG: hypothetical protein MJ165_03805 [Alphaproteobacteria bacterium]|nr:hypothetical protein [Alphaproteobacteria bacterium]